MILIDQLTHALGWTQTPQVFPEASLIYPFYPHCALHEFLIFQNPWLLETPTNSTAWFIFASQLLKTPDLYELQLVASTVTEIGLV
jgi:hypothetical protein